MKILILIAASLALLGCGQDKGPNLSNAPIVWQGYPHQDQDSQFTISEQFNETMACLNKFGIYKDGEPFIIIVENSFPGCTDAAILNEGCYYNGTVYSTVTYVIPSTLLYINIFKHEIVHWATELGNEYHDSIYFTKCVSNR